jgi:hypothetical protein
LCRYITRDKMAPLLAHACPEEVLDRDGARDGSDAGSRGGSDAGSRGGRGGSGSDRVRVHDAFVVRYSAAAQHHLPTHADQSLLSVTLALNDAGEYQVGRCTSSRIRSSLDRPLVSTLERMK